MVAPPIRYTTSADGTKIAYWVLGDGPTTMVHLPYAWGHLRNEWELPEIASWYERLATGRTLITYDRRGMGLSGPAQDASIARGEREDLEAVLTDVGVERAAFLGFFTNGWAAIRFAAKFPERVSHLVLWGSATSGAELFTGSVVATSEIGILDRDQYARAVAHSFIGWGAGDVVDRYIAATLDAPGRRPGKSAGLAATGLLPRFQTIDISGFAKGLQVPTLVLHARKNRFVTQEAAARLAATIPHARLVMLEGESLFLPVEVADEALTAINAFMLEHPEPREASAIAATQPASEAVAGPPYADGLSGREVEVLRLVAMGASNPEIAEQLVISINTVTSHLTHIYQKTGTNNRVEATRYAIERGLTE